MSSRGGVVHTSLHFDDGDEMEMISGMEGDPVGNEKKMMN